MVKGISRRQFYERFRENANCVGALANLQSSLELNPVFAPAHSSLADLYMGCGDWASGYTAASILIDLLPNCRDGYIERGKCSVELAHREAALLDFLEAAKRDPKCADTAMSLGATLTALERDDDAIAHYQRAIDLELPHAFAAHYNIGMAYKRTGRFKLALAAFEKARPELTGQLLIDLLREIEECRSKVP